MVPELMDSLEVFYETLAAAQLSAQADNLSVTDRNLELLTGGKPILPSAKDEPIVAISRGIMTEALAHYRGKLGHDIQVAARYASKYDLPNV